MSKPGAPTVVKFAAIGLLFGIIGFFVMLFLIKVMWAWTVPDLFPGAVEQGLIAARISWMSAVKLAILCAIFIGLAGGKTKS